MPKQSTLPPLKPLVLAAHIALAAMFALDIWQPAFAQQAATRIQYDIPAGELADALVRFAQRAGVTVVVDDDSVKGIRTAGLRGVYTVDEGFNALLAGSGFVIGTTAAGYVLVSAPAPADARRTPVLPEVVVTGASDRDARDRQRREQAVQARLDSASPMVIVDRTQIETLSDARISDVVSRLPGTYAGGPPGEKKSINLRGVSGDFGRFSFDGAPLPSSGGSRNIDLQRISSFIVEDVTYLRSPSAEHEADGITGRLVMRPRVIPDVAEYEIDVAAGGLDKLAGGNRSVKLGYASRLGEHFGVAAAFGYDRFDSIKNKDFSEKTFSGGGGPALNQGFVIDERDPTRTESFNLFLDLAHYHEGGSLHLRPLLLQTVSDSRVDGGKVRDRYNRVPGTFRDRTISSGKETTRTNGLTFAGNHTFGNGIALDGAAMAARARFDKSNAGRTLNSSLAFSGASAGEARIDDDVNQLALNLTVPIAASWSQNLKGGAIVRRSTQRNDLEIFTVSATGVRSQSAADRARSDNSDYRVRETYASAYIQNEVTIGRLTAIPGVRIERARVSSLSGSGASSRDTFQDVLPSLPISYRLSETLTLRAAVARHVNRPKLNEIAPGSITRGPSTFEGNPGLLPARSRSIDLGVDYGKGDMMLGMNVFHRRVRDLNEAREILPNRFVFDNVGDGYIRGIEFDQRLSLSALGFGRLDGFFITANQAFLDSRVSDPLTGRRSFTDQPRFISNLTLDYRHAPSGLRAAVGWNHISKRTSLSYQSAGAIRDKTIRAQNFVDLRIERSFPSGMTLYLSGENLTSQKRDEFEILSGTLDRTAKVATGRSYFVGLNWRL